MLATLMAIAIASSETSCLNIATRAPTLTKSSICSNSTLIAPLSLSVRRIFSLISERIARVAQNTEVKIRVSRVRVKVMGNIPGDYVICDRPH